MRYLLAAALVGLGPCGKEARPQVDATPSVTPSATASYGPAVFRAQTCPRVDKKALPYPPSLEGCEACKTDEFCKEFSIRGRSIGQCTKSNCQQDADCKAGLCLCGPPNECSLGNCRGPEDCGGRDCKTDSWRYGHGRGQWCRTKDDACASHVDCGKGKECAYLGGKWGCRPETPAPPPG